MSRPAGTELPTEARSFLAGARRLVPLGLAIVVLPAPWFGGLPATLAALVGAGLAGLAHLWLARGLAALLQARTDGARGRRWALWSLVPRQALLAVALWTAVVPLGLPAGWLLAGVTVWPVAFTVAGLVGALAPEALNPAALPRPTRLG